MNLSWILIDAPLVEDLVAELGMVITSNILEDPGDLGTRHVPFAAATLRSGWSGVFCIYGLALDAAIRADQPQVAQISNRYRVVVGMELSHALCSYCSVWQKGEEVWSVRHLRENGADSLEMRGILPAVVTDLRESALLARQRMSDVDFMYSVPIEAARTVSGFRYDCCDDDDFIKCVKLSVPNIRAMTTMSRPPKWWHLLGSIPYDGSPLEP